MVLDYIKTICNEMAVGNFSLPIFIVGILQLIEMKKKNRGTKND